MSCRFTVILLALATRFFAAEGFSVNVRTASRPQTYLSSSAADEPPVLPLFSGTPFFGKNSVASQSSTADAAITKTTHITSSKTEMKWYRYDGWNLTYRYRPASPGYENAPPILMIHPVGIGMSSWFWERTMEAFEEGPAMLAPSLIGCGVSEGSDAWNPDKRGLFVPLDWVKGCEALMEQYFDGNRTPWHGILGNKQSYTVVAQGGLAPIGVLLANRNPKTVQQLVLASPPTWKDMTTAVPESELAKNYNFFRNPIWGNLAFKLLETKKAVSFFSNLFLFSNPCDDYWIDSAAKESLAEARAPVAVFNSGFCLNKSLEAELMSLQQPTLIVEGEDDIRERQEYSEKMSNCKAVRLPGKNVLPWEFPEEFSQALFRAVN